MQVRVFFSNSLWWFLSSTLLYPIAAAQTSAPPNAAPSAQAAAPAVPAKSTATTLSVEVKVVTLPVTVRDKHGQIVKGLSKEDFTVTEDSHPQAIKYFNVDTNLPLTLGLLVDSSMSQKSVLEEEKT